MTADVTRPEVIADCIFVAGRDAWAEKCRRACAAATGADIVPNCLLVRICYSSVRIVYFYGNLNIVGCLEQRDTNIQGTERTVKGKEPVDIAQVSSE